jgi:hypothetical protein
MDEIVQQLQALTNQTLNKLDSLTYEELSDFVERREVLLSQMKALRSTSAELAKHKEAIAGILRQDAVILARMEALKHEASQAMSKLSKSRQQKNAYDTTYSMDGVYFDKKK